MSEATIFEIFTRLQSEIENLVELDPLNHQKVVTLLRDSQIEVLNLFINSNADSDQNKAFNTNAIIINNQSTSESPDKTPGCDRAKKTFSF